MTSQTIRRIRVRIVRRWDRLRAPWPIVGECHGHRIRAGAGIEAMNLCAQCDGGHIHQWRAWPKAPQWVGVPACLSDAAAVGAASATPTPATCSATPTPTQGRLRRVAMSEIQEALERAYEALCDVRDIAAEEEFMTTAFDADKALTVIERMLAAHADPAPPARDVADGSGS